MLIVEDNTELLELVSQYFSAKNFAVDATFSGAIASEWVQYNEYDIVLLDYILPDMTAITLCEKIRQLKKTMPILVLSVRTSVSEKVQLFTAGADDYVVKPFSFEEIAARVTALLRRPTTMIEDIIVVGPLSMDTITQIVTINGVPRYFTSKEYALLEFFLRNMDRIVTRSMILEHVWSSDSDPLSNTIEAHLFNVRKKIRDVLPNFIKTVSGRGYMVSERYLINN